MPYYFDAALEAMDDAGAPTRIKRALRIGREMGGLRGIRTAACVSAVWITTLLAAAPAVALPRLSYSDANYYASIALHRNFKSSFDNAYNKKVHCGRRLGYSSRKCRNVGWVIGDLSFHGWVRIWLSKAKGQVWWNYAYMIHRTDEYCLATGGSDCTDTFHKD